VALLLVAVALLGLAVGSFLNVVIHRVPARQSLSTPSSRCPECGHPVRHRHNVPVLGWLLLKGRCADCRSPISPRYPAVELLTALLFVAVTARLAQLDLLAALPAFLVFVAAGVALAAIDLEVGRLPDAIVLPTYPVLGALLVTAGLVTGDLQAVLRALIGAVAAFAAFYVLALAYPGGMGFGDVKLAGLVGGLLAYVAYPVLLVGLAAAFLLGALIGVAATLRGRASRKSTVPFGPFMVAGALAALFVGGPLADLYSRALLSS
jgi:leader peptidase (prepilin peptidase) / N-methyltransferase